MDPRERQGTGFGVLAYLWWGIFPLYFRLLDASGPVEIVLHRIVWSLAVCLGVVAVTRSWTALREVLGDHRRVAWLATAAAILALNWGVYVYAVNAGHVVEASLGYFVNPLVTVLLGVLVLGERLRGGQWVAVGVGTVAVLVLTADYGRVPVLALTLAVSFGGYGLLKHRLGVSVPALTGLTVEALVLTPPAVAVLTWFAVTGRSTFAVDAPRQGLLLSTAGIATVVPLLLFAAAARRVQLTTIGLLQYLTPTLQFLIGVLVLDEHMPASRWVGYTLVWAALAVLTVDGLRAARQDHRPEVTTPVSPEVTVPVNADVHRMAATRR
ncbi:MAG: EamA family transporter RarD [Actinomycetales bacterium]|nr:EamA family transporter RarD [Actinomycetales bacterium]